MLGRLRLRHIVAVGESQSAFYLTTFADTLQPLSHPFDGIFIHSRGGGGAGINGGSVTSSSLNSDLRIRTDLHVPVFMFETQTDLIELGYAAAQQPNTLYIRTWEVAGTSHADEYLVGRSISTLLGCHTAINSGPQHDVVQAVFAAFTRWVVHRTLPPSPSPFGLQRAPRRRSPWIRTATSSAGCARRRSTCRFQRSAGQEHQARASSAHSSARPCPFRRRCWSGCTARRPTTCRGSQPSSTERSLRATCCLQSGRRSWPRRVTCNSRRRDPVTTSGARAWSSPLLPRGRYSRLRTTRPRRRRCDSELEQSDAMGVPKDENVT